MAATAPQPLMVELFSVRWAPWNPEWLRRDFRQILVDERHNTAEVFVRLNYFADSVFVLDCFPCVKQHETQHILLNWIECVHRHNDLLVSCLVPAIISGEVRLHQGRLACAISDTLYQLLRTADRFPEDDAGVVLLYTM